jgi:hypothetical protein
MLQGIRRATSTTTTTTTVWKKYFILQNMFVAGRRNNNNFPQRYQSTSNEKEEGPIVLYERYSNRLGLQRGAIAISTFHTGYWTWYNYDFIPVVNHSPIEAFHIDPLIGFLGLLTAVFGQAVTYLYTSRLISKLEYDGNTHDIYVYTHRIPLVTPSHVAKCYPIGSLKLNVTTKQLYSIPLSTSTISMLKERANDYTVSNFLKLPMFLDIQEQDKLDPLRIIPALVETSMTNLDDYNHPPKGPSGKKRKKLLWKVGATTTKR